MSTLENENKIAIRAMTNGDPISLSTKAQTSLCRWALMKAMILESANRQKALFYDSEERAEIKSAIIPVGTIAWLARLSGKGFHAGVTGIWGEVDKVPRGFHGTVGTIIMGHLVFQVLSGHTHPQFEKTAVRIIPKDGPWSDTLLEIWPTRGDLSWPPAVSITTGSQNSIGSLVDRWKIGTDIG